MDKKRENSTDSGFIKSFFLFIPNRWIIGISIILIGTILIYYLSIPAISVFPSGKDYRIVFYTDRANGGNSEIIKQSISDSTIDLEFELKEGFASPYVGLSITSLKDSVIDLSRYNQIYLEIAGQRINGIGVSIYTKNPYGNKALRNNDLCLFTNLEITPENRQYLIKVDQLKIPDWWTDYNHISNEVKVKPDLKNILSLNIGTAYSPVIGQICSLQIKSISLSKNNNPLILWLLLLETGLILMLALFHLLTMKLKKSDTIVTINYKPIEIEKQVFNQTGFLDYINNNFHENNLTVEQVSNNTGINERRIATVIQENFGCNFKTYVNQIRINESKRLLKESDLNIGEIAFKVGFNNQSHFNRVFKAMNGSSPSEFREMVKH